MRRKTAGGGSRRCSARIWDKSHADAGQDRAPLPRRLLRPLLRAHARRHRGMVCLPDRRRIVAVAGGRRAAFGRPGPHVLRRLARSSARAAPRGVHVPVRRRRALVPAEIERRGHAVHHSGTDRAHAPDGHARITRGVGEAASHGTVAKIHYDPGHPDRVSLVGMEDEIKWQTAAGYVQGALVFAALGVALLLSGKALSNFVARRAA